MSFSIKFFENNQNLRNLIFGDWTHFSDTNEVTDRWDNSCCKWKRYILRSQQLSEWKRSRKNIILWPIAIQFFTSFCMLSSGKVRQKESLRIFLSITIYCIVVINRRWQNFYSSKLKPFADYLIFIVAIYIIHIAKRAQ